jgi:hypothetical protein
MGFMSAQNKYRYYQEKYELALLCRKPSPVIGEIGVRNGYSAASFGFAHPDASYHGWDLINGGHGGLKSGIDTFPYVKGMLSSNFPSLTIALEHRNSQEINHFDVTFDLFHVDGNHSTKGCLHDMKTVMASMSSGGLMIVDDYEYIGGVKAAVHAFIEQNEKFIDKFELRPSGFRGNALIWRSSYCIDA